MKDEAKEEEITKQRRKRRKRIRDIEETEERYNNKCTYRRHDISITVLQRS
jgi:hypothetical protein